jgi:hypothetical protein
MMAAGDILRRVWDGIEARDWEPVGAFSVGPVIGSSIPRCLPNRRLRPMMWPNGRKEVVQLSKRHATPEVAGC